MADQLGRSVGDMYVGAIVPAGLMILACSYLCICSHDLQTRMGTGATENTDAW